MVYTGRRVLVTGGLGFIGSNLAIRAVALGAEVTIVDSSVAGCGANLYNIEPIRSQARVLSCDIGQADEVATAIARADVIFNLAGEISHLRSMEDPERDLTLNTIAQLRFLNICTRKTPAARIVYAGTRQIYGAPLYLPVDEAHPIHAVDFNGIHKHAAAMYHLMLTHAGLLDAVELRLTNVYGPRMALHLPAQGFLSAYLRHLTLGEGLEVYGDGEQLRDPLYVEDVIDAFLLAGSAEGLASRTFNVGGPEALPIAEIARVCSAASGGVPITFRPFPPELKKIDVGSYSTDCSLIERELGWRPTVKLADGIGRTLRYYAGQLDHYLPGERIRETPVA